MISKSLITFSPISLPLLCYTAGILMGLTGKIYVKQMYMLLKTSEHITIPII